MSRASLLACIAGLSTLSFGCGANVVFGDPDSGGGGTGGSTLSAFTNGGAPATITVTTPSTDTGFTTSATMDPCASLSCGADCVVCNDMECLEGFCDDQGACNPRFTCETTTLCYQPDATDCASIERAPFHLCVGGPGCGGKGCSFIGTVVDGPFTPPDGSSCCYTVTGGCVPNP